MGRLDGVVLGVKATILMGTLAFSATAKQAPPAFDVVAIHLSKTPRNINSFGPVGAVRNGRWRQSSVTVSDLIAFAYDLHCCDLVEGGPEWVKTQTFSIEATTTAPTVSTEEERAMIRQLLADRFHLVSHAGTETEPAYTLDLAPGGPKLKPAADDCTLPVPLVLSSRMPPGCGITLSNQGPDRTGFFGRSVSMPYLAFFFETLSGQWGERRAVVDRTGLPGRYDLDLSLDLPAAVEGESSSDHMLDEVRALARALLQQAGLKADLFNAVKLPIAARVVDAAEMPSN